MQIKLMLRVLELLRNNNIILIKLQRRSKQKIKKYLNQLIKKTQII